MIFKTTKIYLSGFLCYTKITMIMGKILEAIALKNLYDFIFKRKSIRRYDMTPLESSVLVDIENFANGLPHLFDVDIKLDFITQVKNPLPIKMPHYLVISSLKDENELMNVGYILENIDLYLSSIGLGCCYLGMAKPAGGTLEKTKYKFSMVLGFGKPDVNLHRDFLTEFNRKPIDQIKSGDGYDKVFEAVRLAPSATNSQPWFFVVDGDKIVICRYKLNLAKKFIYDRMNQIDIGVALCDMKLALKQQGKDMKVLVSSKDKAVVPAGYKYAITVIVK